MLSGAWTPLSTFPHPAFQGGRLPGGVDTGRTLIGLVEDVLLLKPYSSLKSGICTFFFCLHQPLPLTDAILPVSGSTAAAISGLAVLGPPGLGLRLHTLLTPPARGYMSPAGCPPTKGWLNSRLADARMDTLPLRPEP